MLYSNKNKQIEILKQFSEICLENNIDFYLYFGSLLGAIRHKGFIPWDDDIDVCLFRNDYEFLFKINWEKYNLRIISNKTDSLMPYPFIKISKLNTNLFEKINGNNINIGIHIDVFPIDNYKSGSVWNYNNIMLLLFKNIYDIKTIDISCVISPFKKSFILFCQILLTNINLDSISKKIEKHATFYSNLRSIKHVGCMVGAYNLNDYHDIRCFGFPNYVQFENLLMPVPHNSDKILKNLYGNYMKIPKIEDRQSKHSFNEGI